jgi:hypothetical protein
MAEKKKQSKPSDDSSAFRELSKSLDQRMDKETTKLLLKRVEEVNRQSGFLAWDPEKIKANPISEPGIEYPRLTPPTAESPRLFISYSWSRDTTYGTYESDLWVDAFAGGLFGRGYNIYFDRDPRNSDKGLSWFQILRRMNECNYFVPILTDGYIQRVTDPKAVGPLISEWKYATKLYPDYITFIGVKQSGLQLPEPLTLKNTIDLSDDEWGSPWGDAITAIFPSGGIPKVPPPGKAIPYPPDWPAFKPY